MLALFPGILIGLAQYLLLRQITFRLIGGAAAKAAKGGSILLFLLAKLALYGAAAVFLVFFCDNLILFGIGFGGGMLLSSLIGFSVALGREYTDKRK